MEGDMKKHLVTAAALAVLTMSAAGAASANEPKQHDGGFFLRLSAGLGSAQTKWDDLDDDEAKVSGLSGDANFAVGANVGGALAIHGTFWGFSMTDPELESGGVEIELDDATYSVSAFGAGLTYYTDSNFYVSPSIGLATASIEFDNVTVESDTGFAVDLTIGKEWWVSDKWGLGVAAGFGFHAIPLDEDVSEDDATGNNFALRFSATFN
jgi:opacity protein-like surface antigen